MLSGSSHPVHVEFLSPGSASGSLISGDFVFLICVSPKCGKTSYIIVFSYKSTVLDLTEMADLKLYSVPSGTKDGLLSCNPSGSYSLYEYLFLRISLASSNTIGGMDTVILTSDPSRSLLFKSSVSPK